MATDFIDDGLDADLLSTLLCDADLAVDIDSKKSASPSPPPPSPQTNLLAHPGSDLIKGSVLA